MMNTNTVMPAPRRIVRVLIFCVTGFAPLLTNPTKAADKRPNVLWLTCEDISPNLGCYGDDYAITSNLDQLAKEGVRYTRTVGICGVCAVNRSCLITRRQCVFDERTEYGKSTAAANTMKPLAISRSREYWRFEWIYQYGYVQLRVSNQWQTNPIRLPHIQETRI